MELQHLFHHGKAQTVALSGVAGVALIELFKDVRLRVGAHPLALIGHRDHQGVFCFAQVHGHGAALRAELGGVVQQVEPDFFQQPLAAGVLCRGKIGIKIQLLLPPLLLGHQHALAQLFIQGEARFVGQDSLALHPVQGQNIRCQVGQPPALVPDDGQVFLLILGRQLLFQQQVGKAADADDGRFEFMGEVVDKILPQDLSAAQLLRCLVEALLKLDHLPGHVAVFRVIYTHGKVPICQFFHSLNVPLQWVDKDHPYHHHHAHSDQDAHGIDKTERSPDADPAIVVDKAAVRARDDQHRTESQHQHHYERQVDDQQGRQAQRLDAAAHPFRDFFHHPHTFFTAR